MRRVELLEHPWPMILIPWQTGVVFEVQYAGLSCSHAAVEGLCLPLQQEHLRDQLMKLHAGCSRPVTPAEADEIDAMMTGYGGRPLLKVDRDRLLDSWEAWVYVDVCDTDDEMLMSFSGVKAVLTWQNCD